MPKIRAAIRMVLAVVILMAGSWHGSMASAVLQDQTAAGEQIAAVCADCDHGGPMANECGSACATSCWALVALAPVLSPTGANVRFWANRHANGSHRAPALTPPRL